MRFEECNWMDIENYLKKDTRVILVIGACEQHGYLSLLTDVKIPLALADAASNETGVIVAPPVNFGVSPYFLEYPGSIALRVSTLMNVVEDIISSLYHQGFRKFLILNGHSGNEPLKEKLNEVLNKLDELQINWYSWWVSHSIEKIALDNEIKPAHANWLEAFPFTKVCDLPQEKKIPPHYKGLMSAKETRKVFTDGSFGGEYEVDQSIMNQLFQAAYLDVLNLLNFDI